MDDNIKTMEGFTGFLDTDATDGDFFAKASEDPADPAGVPPVEGDHTAPDNEGGDPGDEDKKKGPKVKVVDMFSEAEKTAEDEEDDEEDDPKSVATGTSNSISTLNFLKEKGLIDYKLEDGDELTELKAEELLEDSIEDLFDERFDEFLGEMPDVLKDLNKFVIQGGDINEYLKTIQLRNEAGMELNMDLEEEKNQETVIRNGLREDGYDAEYIEAQIEFLKDSKRLQKHAETLYKKWETAHKAEQTEILTRTAKAQEAAKEQRRALKNKVVSFLTETKEVPGFVVNKDDQKNMPTYMSDRNVKLDNGSVVTGMQRDLMRVLNNPSGAFQMAKLLKTATDEGELKFDEVERESKTKVTKEIREDIRRSKNSIITSSAGGATLKKRFLADNFN